MLLGALDQESGKSFQVLLSLNSRLENGESATVAQWVRDELVSHGFSEENISRLVADNSNDMLTTAELLGAPHIGCPPHLLDLAIDDAWTQMNASFVPTLKSTISTCNNSYNMAHVLENLQTRKPGLKLLDWNETRWQGKFLALRRFHQISQLPEALDKLECKMSSVEMAVIGKLLPLLKQLAALTSLLSGEPLDGVDVNYQTPVHYGPHLLPIIWHSFTFIISCAALDFDSIPSEEGKCELWRFCTCFLDGIHLRFLKDPSRALRASFALSKGAILEYDVLSLIGDTYCLLRCERNLATNSRSVPGQEPNPTILPLPLFNSILQVVPQQLSPNTPFNQSTRLAHLKFLAERFHNAFLDLQDATRQITALHDCLSGLPPPSPSPSVTTARPGTEGFEHVASSLCTPAALRKHQQTATPAPSTLKAELDMFKSLVLPPKYDSALAWACSPDSSAFPNMRRAIVDLHGIPLGSFSAEQVFSALNLQVSPWNTRLNEWDLETRVVLAFNQRHLDVSQRTRVLGWSPFWHLFKDREKVIEQLEEINCIAIGASHRRTAEAARDAKAAKAAEDATRSLSSTPSAPTSPPPMTPVATTKRKRGRPRKLTPIQDDGSDVEFELLLGLTTKTTRPPGSGSGAEISASRTELHDALMKIHQQFRGDAHLLRTAIRQKLKSALHEKKISSSLLELFDAVTDDNVSRLLRSLAIAIKEDTPYSDLAPLLAVEFRPTGSCPASNTMCIDATTDPTLPITPIVQPEPQMALHPIISPDHGLSEDELFDLACRESAQSYMLENKRFSDEMAHLWPRLRQLGLKLMNVPADGNCLYSAVAEALALKRNSRSPLDHMDVRRRLVQYMSEQKKKWFPHLAPKESKKRFLATQAKGGEWGDVNVVKAAAEHFDMEFHVLNSYDDNVELYEPIKSRTHTAIVQLFLVNFRHYMLAVPADQ